MSSSPENTPSDNTTTTSPPPPPPKNDDNNNNPLLPFSPRQRDTSGPFKSTSSPLSDRSNISEPDSLPEVSSYLAALAQLERDALEGSIGWSSSDDEEEWSSEEEEVESWGEEWGEEERSEAENEVMQRMIGMIRTKLGVQRPERLERVDEEEEEEEED